MKFQVGKLGKEYKDVKVTGVTMVERGLWELETEDLDKNTFKHLLNNESPLVWDIFKILISYTNQYEDVRLHYITTIISDNEYIIPNIFYINVNGEILYGSDSFDEPHSTTNHRRITIKMILLMVGELRKMMGEGYKFKLAFLESNINIHLSLSNEQGQGVFSELFMPQFDEYGDLVKVKTNRGNKSSIFNNIPEMVDFVYNKTMYNLKQV